MRALEAITLLGFAATYSMVVVIWVVQLHVYPLFQYVSKESWKAYHAQHLRRLGWIAAPPMLLELGGAFAGLLLVALDPLFRDRVGWYVVLAVLTLGSWALTFLVSVPLHRRLEQEWDALTVERLIKTNWARTLTWSAKAAVLTVGLL